MATVSCTTCGASFASEAEFRAHQSVHMPGAAKGPGEFTCRACHAQFHRESELVSHMRQAHPM